MSISIQKADLGKDKEIVNQIIQKTDEIFGVSDDPTQVPINQETIGKMIDLHPASLLFTTDNSGKLMAWLGSVPTTRDLANDFVSGAITEAEMFKQTKKQNTYEALYLGGVVVLPEFRGRGYAKALIKEAVKEIAPSKDQVLFYWAFSDAGKGLAEEISKEERREIVGRTEG